MGDCEGRFESLSPASRKSEEAEKERQKSKSGGKKRSQQRSKSAPRARETMKYVRITPV